jgi:hypothetical protein
VATFIFLSLQSTLKQSLHSCPLFIGVHVTYFTLLARERTPIRGGLPLFTGLPRETVWKIAGKVLDFGFGDSAAVIKIVDPEKMRIFIQRVPIFIAGKPLKGVLSKAGESLIMVWIQPASVG